MDLPSDNIVRRNMDKLQPPTSPIIIEDDSKIETQSQTMASTKIESIESKSNKSCDYDER